MIKPSPLPTPYSSALSLQGYCNICYAPYDNNQHKPLLICPNNHSTCKQCLLAIKITLRCPFCRTDIQLNRIRLNQAALQQAKLNSKKGSSRNSRRSRNELRVFSNERRIITEEQQPSVSEGEQPSIYLHQSQFLSQIQNIEEEEDNQAENNQSESGWWTVLVYINIIGFQLPIGILSFYLALSQPSTNCFDCLIPNTTLTLRAYWRTTGYIQILLSVLVIYFLAIHYFMSIIGSQGLRIFQNMLTVLTQIKCMVSLIILSYVVRSKLVGQYSSIVHGALVGSFCCNCLSFVLGGFLLYQFCKYSLVR